MGEVIISLVEKEQFWLELVFDIKKADERAESRMLRVIRKAAIGNHEVTEKKVIEDSIKKNIQITTVSKQAPPLKNLRKSSLYFLENFKNK